MGRLDCAGRGAAAFVTTRSANGMTLVLAEALLLTKLGSCVLPVTVAVLVTKPDAEAPGLADIKSEAIEPAGRIPIVQVTLPAACKQTDEPALNVTSGGSVSVTMTWLAVDGPLLTTVKI